MNLLNHPPADSRKMFTELDPKVAERQQKLRDALEMEYKANEHRPSKQAK